MDIKLLAVVLVILLLGVVCAVLYWWGRRVAPAAMTNQLATIEPPGLSRRSPSRIWSLLHFGIRFLGLTGLLVAAVGLVLASSQGTLDSWNDFLGTYGGGNGELIAWLVGAGTAAAGLALLVELLVMLFLTAGRRSALGFNALVQIVLAAILLVGVNLWSAANLKVPLFGHNFDFPAHYARFDLTRKHEFTLRPEVRKELEKLQGDTTVIVYQRHRTFGGITDVPDQYDAAAERKVVEKFKDLVDQLRELGQHIHVEVLDTEAEGYYDKLAALTRNAPELKKAIEAAPENSLFFHATAGGGQVQQLSFNDFLRLDKTSSRAANKGKGNLVLSKGGVKPIERRIVNLEQRKPVVGVLVVHEALTTEGNLDFYTTAGVRKTLQANGFDVRNVILKRFPQESRGGEPEPAVDLLEDSKLDRLQDESKLIKEDLEVLNEQVKMWTELNRMLADKKMPLLKINEKLFEYRIQQLPGDDVRPQALSQVQEKLALMQQLIQDSQERAKEIADEMRGLNAEVIGERRRVTDLKSKLDRVLSECDLLLLPRLTTGNDGERYLSSAIHNLDPKLVVSIKEYIRAGKPVLAAFGPPNKATGAPDPTDDVETLFQELGVRLGKKTVLFDAEKQSFTSVESSIFRIQPERLQPLDLKGVAEQQAEPADLEMRKALTRHDLAVVGTWLSTPTTGALPAGVVAALPRRVALPARTVNPIRRSLAFTEQCLGSPLKLILRKPRPVLVDADVAGQLTYETAILKTSQPCWTDENPFSSRARLVPRYERPTGFDPDAGTIDEKRRGPFVIAAACETKVPKSWLVSQSDTQEKVRLVAIGSGSLFVGKNLSLAQERLLLDSCNWLLHRDDRLAHTALDFRDPEWQYPRVDLSDKTERIWLWTCRLGLPLLFAYLGLVTLLFRRLR